MKRERPFFAEGGSARRAFGNSGMRKQMRCKSLSLGGNAMALIIIAGGFSFAAAFMMYCCVRINGLRKNDDSDDGFNKAQGRGGDHPSP
jgi:hypothetical protein